jgi:uncharacterized membrane protein HdeD (DUF308 family)
MTKSILKKWWTLILRGLISVFFGILVIANPAITLAVLTSWFGIFIIADSVLALFSVFSHWNDKEDKWLLVVEGLITLGLGMVITISPIVTLSLVIMFIALWAILSGISRIASGIQLRKEIEGEGWMILGGILSVFFGFLIITRPGIGIATAALFIGVYSIAIGLVMVMLGWKVKKVHSEMQANR